MFVNLILFPALQRGGQARFREWFEWSSGEYSKQPGFMRRRLLKERKAKGYAVILEMDSYDSFMAALGSPVQQEAQRRLVPLLDGNSVPHFYDVLLDEGSDRKSGFVNVVFFPPLRRDKYPEFRAWFQWSSAQCAQHPGFHRRRLLQPVEGGNYAAIEEHESFRAFTALHTSQAQVRAGERVVALLDGEPHSRFFEGVSP